MINIMEVLNNCKDMGYDNKIKVVNICNLMETVWPDFFGNFKLYNVRENELTEAIRPGIGKDFHYYGKPREDFFIWEAIKQAKEKGLPIVIVEDMS